MGLPRLSTQAEIQDKPNKRQASPLATIQAPLQPKKHNKKTEPPEKVENLEKCFVISNSHHT